MMTSTHDAAAWSEASLFKGSYAIEHAINTAQPYQFQEWRDQLIERGALGSPWRQAAQGIGLPLEAADHVANYVRSRDRVHISLYELLEKDDTALDKANEQYHTRRENLRLFFVARMTELGMTPEAANHLITLYRAWERGRSHGVDSATAHVQDCLKKKPTSITLLRFWFSWLGVLPVGRGGGSGKKKSPVTNPPPNEEPTAQEDIPLPSLDDLRATNPPRPGSVLLKGPFNVLGPGVSAPHPGEDSSETPQYGQPDITHHPPCYGVGRFEGGNDDEGEADTHFPPLPWGR